jgi:hypothetical protein
MRFVRTKMCCEYPGKGITFSLFDEIGILERLINEDLDIKLIGSFL